MERKSQHSSVQAIGSRILSSDPSIFILESLTRKNEKAGEFEGEILERILLLSGMKSEYIYVRTQSELVMAMKEFQNSRKRYLHLSCHGSSKGEICLTLDDLDPAKFVKLIAPYMTHCRRFFVSACKLTTMNLAKRLIEETQIISLTGPRGNVYFDQAALAWSTFYFKMADHSRKGMKNEDVISTLEQVTAVFDIPVRHFTRLEDDEVEEHDFTTSE